MGNQASEDELDVILSRIISQESGREGGWAGFMLDDKEYIESIPYGNPLVNQQELKQAINALILTEKLKLLAEVRERVVGESESITELEPYGDRYSTVCDRNAFRSEQIDALTKLEAEL